jgi:hypothetical protein
MPGEGGFPGGAAYRNRTDDLRITRGQFTRYNSLTCTDGRMDGTGSTDCTGFRGHPFHDPFHGLEATVTLHHTAMRTRQRCLLTCESRPLAAVDSPLIRSCRSSPCRVRAWLGRRLYLSSSGRCWLR